MPMSRHWIAGTGLALCATAPARDVVIAPLERWQGAVRIGSRKAKGGCVYRSASRRAGHAAAVASHCNRVVVTTSLSTRAACHQQRGLSSSDRRCPTASPSLALATVAVGAAILPSATLQTPGHDQARRNGGIWSVNAPHRP